MRGPLYVVAQNVWLRPLKVMCVLKLCFSGSLDDLRARYGSRLRRLAPFHFRQVDRPALGESTASLPRKPDLTFQQLDPRRALQVLHWPIRVIRVVTDPVVDSILLVVSYLILPSIVRMLDGFFTAASWVLSAVVPGDVLEKSLRFADTSVSLPFPLWHRFTERMVEGEYREFLMEYCKQLHHLRCFKVRYSAKLQFDTVRYHSPPGIKAANCCSGGALRRSIRQAGQDKFISGRDWLDAYGPRGWHGREGFCYRPRLRRHWTTGCLLP